MLQIWIQTSHLAPFQQSWLWTGTLLRNPFELWRNFGSGSKTWVQ